MSKPTYIQNTFEKGLFTDGNPNSQPEGTYDYALNTVNRDFEQVLDLSNENSNRLSIDLGSEIIGGGYIDERDRFLMFTRNGLYLVDINTNTSEFVATDSEFGCNWNLDACNWIRPQFFTIDPCSETYVYWSSGCEYFKLNIDEMLDPVRKNALKASFKPQKEQCSDITCEYFKVFKLVSFPKISPVGYNTGGGGLLAGAYQFSVRLKTYEGGFTNWFTISDPVYISGEHNEAGEITNGYIEVNLSCLDCRYDYGELAVVKTIGGIVTADVVTEFNYADSNFSFTYMGGGVGIDLAEILTRGKTYLRGQDLIQYNGNMLYYNIRQSKNYNYQLKANEIGVTQVMNTVPVEIAKRYNLKSFMRGETYAFGIAFNDESGRKTRVFHIPAVAQTSGGGNNASSIGNSSASVTEGDYTISQEAEYRRQRSPIPDTVEDPQLDDQTTNTAADIDAMETDKSDVSSVLSDCEDCPPAASTYDTDIPKAENVVADQGAVLRGLGGDGGSNDLTVDYSPSTLKELAQSVMSSVENRERTVTKGKQITVNKGNQFKIEEEVLVGNSGPLFDCCHKPEVELSYNRIEIGNTIIKREEDILYPTNKGCDGQYIYGDLAGEKVRHHQITWGHLYPHYVSNAVGVPSKATPDASEFSDAYVNIISLKFSNIYIPTEEELGFKVSETNPYTIFQIPRSSKNKTIHSKGILTNTLQSSNDGKNYLYPSHGLNSEDSIVNRYIKIGDSRLDSAAFFGTDYNFWSLDTMTKAPALNVTQFKKEGVVSGSGYRHNLYEEGFEPPNSLYSSRVDQRGTRQAINLNRFSRENGRYDLRYKTYASANEVISPPDGAEFALMNKYQQESAWIGINALAPLSDRSFKGDVLTHSAPITDAKTYYGALIRDLPNQYGDITNAPYIPILQAGKYDVDTIEGMCGDTFIGPHSFYRTSYVSDKVGNMFPIENMVPGKADRCVCDSPEDAVVTLNGMWIPTTLPKDGDKADAKNWAGLHTDTTSHSWATSNNEKPISDYYYPKVVKTLITYWGEFEVNPWLRQTGDLLEEQVYGHISPEFGLDSSIQSNSGKGWDDDFLNQFYWEVAQPSKWTIIKKTLIRSIINVVFLAFGIGAGFTGDTALELVTNLGVMGSIMALWFQANKVLFTNKRLDELFGIPDCRKDDEGGEDDLYIMNFQKNFNKYNSDFSVGNNIETEFGLPTPYYTCDCDDCELNTTNEVYVSDDQKSDSQLDAYAIVRPNNMIDIPPSFGHLTDIFIDTTNLYAHTTDQIIPLRYGRVTMPSSAGEIIMGAGPILAKPTGMSEGTSEGFAGLLSPQHVINTNRGRFFVDYKARRVYQFYNGLKELTPGMSNHFRELLEYCSENSCSNEHLSGNDIALGLDPRLDRFLLTKRDSNPWTVSFDILQNHWVSFHSYTPKFYLWDRSHMITSDGTALWVHDVKDNFQTFMGTYYPHEIEFKIKDNRLLEERWNNGILESFAVKAVSGERFNLLDRDVTFNKLWARNNYQHTGILDIVYITPRTANREDLNFRMSETYVVKMNREQAQWRYNDIWDLTENYEYPLYVQDPCSPFISPVNFLDSKNKSEFRSNMNLNNYLSIRFIFDNFADYKLYTRRHLTFATELQELYG